MNYENVDIIIPVHNSEKFLLECLNSVESQNYNNIHLIIINDGSTDSSQNIIDSFKRSSHLEITVLFNKSARGVSKARNQGLDIANGPYVTFLDSDDVLLKDHINDLVQTIKVTKSKLAITGAIKQTKINHINSTLKLQSVPSTKAMKAILGFGNIQGYSVNKLYKLEKINRVGLKFDNSLFICEDLYFVCSYIKEITGEIGFTGTNTYIYRENEDSNLAQRKKLADIIKKGKNEQRAYAAILQIMDTEQEKKYCELKKTWAMINFIKRVVLIANPYHCIPEVMDIYSGQKKHFLIRAVLSGFFPLKDLVHLIIDIHTIQIKLGKLNKTL
ncbi:glycosyltransferase family 2 protein [Limosilactobacillus caviae]|uniref:Glycosyl transferase n=1 Tax=Limosilactobacillus caviae TaxID=1769424 RepID=A0ABQ2C7B8_9LACO|nr:glycosyltransferase family 2 protein [Limosilactobacillus caviae]MCD7124512.1 glycosyltransferase family 2 protein [Limosilactobacillus caviae]MRH47262.1 glycosyltransferase [Limosilactobacillus reuteri]GGI64278.1 glycosyl transferase [Limosilactobacillus caviae]